MARPKQDLVKITTNMNTNVLQAVDKWAQDNGLTRTTAITLLLTKGLHSEGYKNE